MFGFPTNQLCRPGEERPAPLSRRLEVLLSVNCLSSDSENLSGESLCTSVTLPSLKSGTFAPTAHATSTAVNELTSGAEMRGVLSDTLLRVTNYSGSRGSTRISQKFRITADLVPNGLHTGCFPDII